MEPETKTERRLLTTVAAPSHTAGKSMNLTHISILIGLVMWGSLWGIPGAVLSVPLLGIQKILMSNACVRMPNCDRPTAVAYSCLFRTNLSGLATRVRMRGPVQQSPDRQRLARPDTCALRPLQRAYGVKRTRVKCY